MKKSFIIILLLAVTLVFTLAACGDRGGSGSLGDVSQYEPETLDAGDETPGGFLTREDEEGLVTVRVGGGSAEIFFNLERWGDLNTGQDEFTEGPFQIVSRSGAVVDAIVGKVEAIDLYSGLDMPVPTVALLTEHGRVEYFMADPSVGWRENEYLSFGVLPWLKDIESFTYEKSVIGDEPISIFAWDSEGYKYNISLVAHLINIFHPDSVWEHYWMDNDANVNYLGMTMTESGTMDLVLGWENGEIIETEQTYSGTYEVMLAENSGTESGAIAVNLDCTWWIAELGEGASEQDLAFWDERMNIEGSFYMWADGDGYLNLYNMYGDVLAYTGWLGDPIIEYSFWQTVFF